MEFFKNGGIKAPQAIAAAPREHTAKSETGLVQPNFKQGSIFLKNADDKIMRLAWEPVGDQKPTGGATGRALAKGIYTLTEYRIVRSDDRGAEWIISVILAHHDQHQIKVEPGKVTRLQIEPSINVECDADASSKFIVRSFFNGMHRAGLTIYKDGKRIPLRFKITSPDGETLESKPMDYG